MSNKPAVSPVQEKILQEEKHYLSGVIAKLNEALQSVDSKVSQYANELHETKEYLYENKAEMDRMEKFAVRQSVIRGAIFGEEAVNKKKRLQKLADSPYFGRIDFKENGLGKSIPVYIGIQTFYDEKAGENLIYDWRAPISGLFYDFGLGKAFYEAPSGRVKGSISLKRQYHIRKGKMEYMLENASQIYDEVLQQELSRSSDNKMKHIVASIQRDQNPIVRNEASRTLIIQGVAGSGKTSIALHRIAFLLYRFKDSLTAENILIISPNKIYADYIANVLPELGEERIPEMGMEDLASKVLDDKFRFQTFNEQVALTLGRQDKELSERIHYKSSNAFLRKLDQYLVHIENEYLSPADIWVGRSLVPEWFTKEQFASFHRIPLLKRFALMAKAVEDNIRIYYKREISSEERKFILQQLTGMFRISNLRSLYKDFYDWLGHPELLKLQARSGYEYADLFPLVYMKIRLEGYQVFDQVKHLLVDEMQDYSPVQYAVLSRLFPCNKTILGDASQKVCAFGSSTAEMIKEVMQEADVVVLRRSYRSSYEITQFAQQILADSQLIPIERHGERPVVRAFPDKKPEIQFIIEQIKAFEQTGYQSFGILCKTQKQLDYLYHQLDGCSRSVSRLTAESHSYTGGIILTTIHLSKGLEFDQVLVPFVTDVNYSSGIDRHLLYIACTRAMHRLFLSFSKTPSSLIPATVNSVS